MLLLLTNLSLAACPDLPVGMRPTTPPLHAVHPAYIRRTVELMDQLSSGPGASPAFRDTWARMDSELALASQDSLAGAPRLTRLEQERGRDLAVVAASMAGEALLNETLARSEILGGTLTAARTVGSPNVEVVERGDKRRVRVNQAPPNRFQAQQVARYDLANGPPRRRGPPPKRVRVGAGSSVLTDDLDNQAPLGLAWTAWVQTERYAVDSVRVAVDLLQLDLGGTNARGQAVPTQANWALAWTVNARHRVHPRWIVSAEARSVPSAWFPRQVRGGLGFLPVHDDPRWLVRWDVRYGFSSPTRPTEQRVDVRLQWNGRWRTPVSPRRDAPGQRAVEPTWWAPQPVPGPNRVSACWSDAP